MFKLIGAALLAAVSTLAPASGATLTLLADAPAEGTIVALSVNDFQRMGHCGGGRSVVHDGCSTVVKDDPLAPHAWGRFDPLGQFWIDSQDIDLLKWTVASPVAFTSMTFAMTDAHDQPRSHFAMSYNEAGTWTPLWDIPSQLPNANLFWLRVDFDQQVRLAEFLFSTKEGPDGYDGYGISQLRLSQVPAPIPAPPAAVLLLSGTVLIASLRRRRKAA